MAKLQAILQSEGAKMSRPIILKNSVQVSKGDPVTIDANGFLLLSTAGDKIHGFSLEDYTAASDNQTVAMYCPAVLEAENVTAVFDSDQDAVQGDVGAYCDIGTSATGGFILNLATGATGQFYVVEKDPFGTGDDSLVAVKVAEPQSLAFAQA